MMPVLGRLCDPFLREEVQVQVLKVSRPPRGLYESNVEYLMGPGVSKLTCLY